MTAYQIKDWGAKRGRVRLFEVSQSARYDNPSWFPYPINFEGECYAALMASDEGERAYGIFTALCALASTTPVRGLLADEDGSYSFRKIGVKTRIRHESVKWGVEYLLKPEIAWIQGVSDVSAARRIKRLSRSYLGDNSEPEQASKQANKQQALELDLAQASAAQDSNAAGEVLAARQKAPPFDMVRILRRWWPNSDKAFTIAAHENATFARVCWLAQRVLDEKPKRPPGFIQKGIEQGWPVPAEFLAKFGAATGEKPKLRMSNA